MKNINVSEHISTCGFWFWYLQNQYSPELCLSSKSLLYFTNRVVKLLQPCVISIVYLQHWSVDIIMYIHGQPDVLCTCKARKPLYIGASIIYVVQFLDILNPYPHLPLCPILLCNYKNAYIYSNLDLFWWTPSNLHVHVV